MINVKTIPDSLNAGSSQKETWWQKAWTIPDSQCLASMPAVEFDPIPKILPGV